MVGGVMVKYDIRETDGKFFVGHQDEHGEWWDADDEAFYSMEDAERFLMEIQSEQDAVELEAFRYAGEIE
jgi:hypothetical protein